MSLVYVLEFQIGAALLLLSLLITYFSNDENYPRYLASILQGLGLGFACVPIFDAPRIFTVIIFLIWMIPLRIQDYSQSSEKTGEET